MRSKYFLINLQTHSITPFQGRILVVSMKVFVLSTFYYLYARKTGTLKGRRRGGEEGEGGEEEKRRRSSLYLNSSVVTTKDGERSRRSETHVLRLLTDHVASTPAD